MSKPTDLVQGTLDLLLLKILALEPLHGWAISLRLRSISGDVLQVSEGSLYPALHKLEQEGWITAEWKQTENNRRAKFYSLTRLGGKSSNRRRRTGSGCRPPSPTSSSSRRPREPCASSTGGTPRRCGSSRFPPPPGGARARRGAAVPPRAQDRGGHRRGLSPEEARDRALRAMGGLEQRKEEMRDARAHPLADGLRRRHALRAPQPAPHARADRVRGGYARARDRHDGDAVQHARRADLPALPGAGPGQRGHAGEHLPRQQLRPVLLPRVPRHPRHTRRATTA